MRISETELIGDYNHLKAKALNYYNLGKYEESLSLINYCSQIGYQFFFKERLKDDQLEEVIMGIAKQTSKSVTFEGINNKVVFIDSYALDNRGLTEQYLNAIFDLGFEILYIVTSDIYFNHSSNIINAIKHYNKGKYIVVNGNLGFLDRADYIRHEISLFKPEKVIIHPSPWDLVMIMVCNSLKDCCHRFFINITDDHYWLGESAFDTIIEFRNFGVQFSKNCREIAEKNIVLLPYYPIIQEDSKFEGLPSGTAGKVVAISGGNGYKFLGNKNRYSALVSKLLEENLNLVLLLVGAGLGGEVAKSLCSKSVQDRIILIPPRKDIFQLIKHCDIYISSIPRAGGLMAQLANEAGLPILNLANKMMRTTYVNDILPFADTKYIDIEVEEEFLQTGNKLINDKEFRKYYAAKAQNSIIKKKDFANGLRSILNGRNPYKYLVFDCKNIQEDLVNYQNLAFETENDHLKNFLSMKVDFKNEFRKKYGEIIFQNIKQKNKSISVRILLSKIRNKLINKIRNVSNKLMNNQIIPFERLPFRAIGQNPIVSNPYIIKNPRYISIGKNFFSLYNLRIEAWDSYISQRFLPEIIIGDNVILNTDVHIGCINKIVIGNNVLMASRIYITDHSHGDISSDAFILPPVERPLISKGPVFIDDNVWIGEGVCILPGVTIGKNSIIGANAVVTKSFPENCVIAGIPAKIIKTL